MSRSKAIFRCVCMLVLAGCGDSIVPDEPIVLVPDADVAGRHRETIEFAAESWNLELGTQFSVADDPGDAQEVVVSWQEDECLEGGVEFLGKVPLRGSPIAMCAKYTRDQYPTFFETMRHELGHVLGLGHNEAITSIMGHRDDPAEIRAVRRHFTLEDRQHFARVNPDFVGLGGCSINHVFAEQVRHPSTVLSRELPYAVWSAGEEISYAPIDPSTGDRADVSIALAMTSTLVMSLSSHPTQDGFLVSWAERHGLYRSFVSTSEDNASPIKQEILAEWNPRVESVASNVYFEGAHLLTFNVRSNMSTRLVLLGADGSVTSSTVVEDRGDLVHYEGQYFLVGSIGIEPGRREASVTRFRIDSDRIEAVERVTLGEMIDVDPEFESSLEPVTALVTRNGVVAVIDRQDRTVMLRISTAGPLQVIHRVELERVERMAISEEQSELTIAGWRRPPELYASELFFAQFDEQSIERTNEWKRVSGVDQFGGGNTFIQRLNDRVLLGWSETTELKTRCISLEDQ